VDRYIHPISNRNNIAIKTGAFQLAAQLADDSPLRRLHVIKAGLGAEHYASCRFHILIICASSVFL
jgi:hypothetical protein